MVWTRPFRLQLAIEVYEHTLKCAQGRRQNERSTTHKLTRPTLQTLLFIAPPVAVAPPRLYLEHTEVYEQPLKCAQFLRPIERSTILLSRGRAEFSVQEEDALFKTCVREEEGGFGVQEEEALDVRTLLNRM